MNIIEQALMELKKITEQLTDEEGRKHIKVAKTVTNEPVNFGSINKPLNTDVISIKIDVPSNLFR